MVTTLEERLVKDVMSKIIFQEGINDQARNTSLQGRRG